MSSVAHKMQLEPVREAQAVLRALRANFSSPSGCGVCSHDQSPTTRLQFLALTARSLHALCTAISVFTAAAQQAAPGTAEQIAPSRSGPAHR